MSIVLVRTNEQTCQFAAFAHGRLWQIVLQKSKVAGIFRENTTRDLIADAYRLNRVTEVACV